MKTFIVLLALTTAVCSSQGQTPARHYQASTSVQFATDEIIHYKNSEDQRNIRLAIAFNGWMYAAYTHNDPVSEIGGIYVSCSKDNGVSWHRFVAYQFSASMYPMTDLIVAGNDTLNLKVFLAGVLHNINTGANSVYMDDFDGRTGSLAGTVFQRQLGTSLHVTDIALATDYLYPGTSSSPYSVGFLYTVQGGPADSLMFTRSTDGGQSFSGSSVVSFTHHSLHKIALSYGRSPAVSSGSYFAAWEDFASPAASVGHIYVSHSNSVSSNSWQNPVCMDSVPSQTNYTNMCRNPAIAIQQGTMDNVNLDLSAVLLFEGASGGNLYNMDIVSAVNRQAYSASSWNLFAIAATGANETEPACCYNSYTNNFLLTYFDSTNGSLPYESQGINISSPLTWTELSLQYNDENTSLASPHPRIEVSPLLQQAAFVWVSENPVNGNGVALFDAEFSGLLTEIPSEINLENEIGLPYPVPANETIRISVTASKTLSITEEVYDILGNLVKSPTGVTLAPGTQSILIAVDDLPGGVYFAHFSGPGLNRSLRFVIQH